MERERDSERKEERFSVKTLHLLKEDNFVYDFRTGEYIEHVIADGFSADSGADGAGSPGSANTFHPFM